MTIEEALQMLKDDDAALDVKGLIALLEDHQACFELLGETLGSSDADTDRLCKLALQLKTKTDADASNANELTARKQKLIERIIGRLELLGKDPARFKKRSHGMDFEELDAELDELEDQLRERFKVERVTKPTDVPKDDVLLLRPNIGDYRV